MKVVKDGKTVDPRKWRKQVACRKDDEHDSAGCGAVLTVGIADLVMMYFKGSHFDHYYGAVRCPQCDKLTRVHRIPGPVWLKFDTAKAKRKALFDGFSDRASCDE